MLCRDRELCERGFADEECEAKRVESKLRALLADRDRLAAMGTAARAMARPDAAMRLADFVEECARG